MPGAGGNSNSNNPTWDFVVHPAGSDAERGIPAVGKVVYRTDLSALQVCTATTPDATLNGGGTWSAGAGGVSGDCGITVTQGATIFDSVGAADVPVFARYSIIGPRVFVEASLVFTAAGTATNGIVYAIFFDGLVIPPRNMEYNVLPTPSTPGYSGTYYLGSGVSYGSAGILSLAGAAGGGDTLILAQGVDPGLFGEPGGAGYTAATDDPCFFSFSYEL